MDIPTKDTGGRPIEQEGRRPSQPDDGPRQQGPDVERLDEKEESRHDDDGVGKSDEKPSDKKAGRDKSSDEKSGKSNDYEKAGDDKGGEEKEGEKKPTMSRGKKLLYGGIALIAVVAIGIAGGMYYANARHFENTDDAFIDTHTAQIAPRVAGPVASISVNDNQRVEVGQEIMRIDDSDYRVRLNEAIAQRGNAAAQESQARAQLGIQQANINQAQSNVAVAEAELTQAEQDFARFKNIDPKAITRQQLDTSSSQLKSATARLQSARQAVVGARAQLEASKAQLEAAQASVRQADTSVENARLQISYTQITAPISGLITRRTFAVGNYLNPGAPVVAIVPDEMWVTANYKESQLTDMREGQPVDIKVDAFPKLVLRGRVDSIQRGSGSAFSSLPAENATGNYVKVVQRVPVKIVFENDDYKSMRLAPGFSVQPSVRVR